MFKGFTYSWISRHKTLTGVLCLLALSFYANGSLSRPQQSQEQLPATGRRIYLLRANTLEYDKSRNADFQILRGDVRFRQDSAYMFCDSAYFYEGTNSLDAFGNVRMEQGDTLFVYGDYLYYDGNTGLARLRDNVRMINRDVTLTTDSLNYDRWTNIGYFFDGGEITDPENRLTSVYGEYSPDTKNAVFQYNVELHNPRFILYSDTLRYNTGTSIADILGPSTIVSDSNTIYSDLGWYDTKRDLAMLLDRSRIVSKTQELIGDTIYYDRKSGYGEVFGNMFLSDTARKVILEGNYGYYNELSESALVTKKAQAIEYSTADSLYLHADTLRSDVVDSSRLIQAYYGVRFFRTDAQGVCDSLKYSTADSLLVMYKNPVIWNMNYQIFGDTILILMNDSTISHAQVKDFAFLAQQKTSEYYDQLSGKIMDAYFEGGELYRMDMNGNVETIFFPEESDKSLIGLNKVQASYLKSFFSDRKLQELVMWPEPKGSLTPIPKIVATELYLPSFHWYEDLRPQNKEDIFRDVKMKVEDIVRPATLFTPEELEGADIPDLPEVERKVRSISGKVSDVKLPREKVSVPDSLAVPQKMPSEIIDSLRSQNLVPADSAAIINAAAKALKEAEEVIQ